jgi:hypothetical protein
LKRRQAEEAKAKVEEIRLAELRVEYDLVVKRLSEWNKSEYAKLYSLALEKIPEDKK